MNYVPVVARTFSTDFAGIQGVSESVADAQIQDKDRLHDENDASEKSPDDSSLKDNGPSHASKDTQMEDQEAELGNIPPSYAVPTTPHTR
ncbi:hypothetical protein Tco_0419476, partial [Tanacetum coccineum]